jgi:Tfp pilus assembly protein PilO
VKTVTKNKTLLIALVAAAAATAAFWFLVLAPKREQAAELETKIATKQSELANAQQTLETYKTSKANYGKNYASLVRLGKAVPEHDDVRSLLVQLDAEAGGTNVDFRTVQIGGSQSSASAVAADAAGQPSTAPPGAVSVGSGGFSAMPFTFSFRGSFGNLSQFFSRMERFVTLRNEQLNVTGRLLRLESIDLQVDQEGFPNIRAQIGATSYIVPPTQGVTAGATAEGPSAATPAATPAPADPSVPTTTATATGATP